MGILGIDSSSFTLGAKWTLLKEGGGGRTGSPSTPTRLLATLLLLGTLVVSGSKFSRFVAAEEVSSVMALLSDSRLFLIFIESETLF